MVYQITLKQCNLSSSNIRLINHYREKINRLLPNYAFDLPLLAITLRKDKNFKRPPKRAEINRKTGVVDFFEGMITLHLPKTPLDIHFKGRTIEGCLDLGFKRIINELKQFKTRHFTNSSLSFIP